MPWLSFFSGRGQSVFIRQRADFRLQQVAEGKHGFGNLAGPHQGKEIRLVLVRVPSAQDERSLRRLQPAGIVARGDVLEALFQGIIQKYAEFHFPVAQHVRIRRISGPVAFNQVVHDACAVFLHEVNHAEFDPDFLGDGQRVPNILFPRAFSGNAFIVHPVFHVGPHDFMALLHEQRRRNGTVHSAG